MLRRILIGAAIASTVFAGSSVAHADYTKPEKDKELECSQVNNATGGLIGGILGNVLNLNNTQVAILAIAEQENCED
ncbi:MULTISPECIES: hypothetical protein [unclassified Nonomuraea]|uniref:hypothetical protein n=1 Tax=Nonomuraea sp. NPDC003804 TaxID=3154547 RepID=UPI0033AA6FD9